MSRKNWWIVGAVISVMVIVIVILIAALWSGNAETAQRERSAMNEREATRDQRITSLEQNQDAQGKELIGLQDQQEIDRLEAQYQQELADVKAQGESAVLKIQLAGIEKDISETKDELKDLSQSCQSPRPQPRYENYFEVSFQVNKSGYYEFLITPSNVEVFIDGGRSVVGHEIIYLTRGWHKYRSNYPVSVTIHYHYR